MKTPSTPVVCRRCEKRVPSSEAFQANRIGGGTYRRPSRIYRSTICVECAAEVVAKTDQFHRCIGGWVYSSVSRGLEAHHG